MKIEQRGLVTGPSTILDKLPASAFKVASWQNGRSPKAQAATGAVVKGLCAAAESIFDAAHGRRYMLFVYTTLEERKACWDFHTGATS